jgi:hypothetical protein
MKILLTFVLVSAAFSLHAVADCPKPFNQDLKIAKQKHNSAQKAETRAKDKCEKIEKGCPLNGKTMKVHKDWQSASSALTIAAANLSAAEKVCAGAARAKK